MLSYVLPFLGADGPRTYLIAGENNAEMRDQGAVLSLALMQTDMARSRSLNRRRRSTFDHSPPLQTWRFRQGLRRSSARYSPPNCGSQ